MFNQNAGHDADRREPLLSRRRIKTVIIGAAVAVVSGLVLVNTFTYFQYGGTMFDRFFSKAGQKSPAAGKFAYTKGRNDYIGIIRGEGRSPSKGKVYYIEQAGGTMIEVAKDVVEVREPEKK